MEYVRDLVSVIIPTYKRSELLTRAIRSVLNQTYPQVEVIVVNDNISRQDEYSAAVYEQLASIHDERVILVEQEKHINGAAARNAGIKKAKGEFIAFLDDDDFWEPDELEIQIRKFRELGPEWGLVSCLNILRNGNRIVGASLPYRDGDMFLDVLERRVGLGTGSPLIRRSALDAAGYFDENLIRHQDLQLFANLTSQFKVKLIKRYLHNIDVSDAQNRPDPEKLKRIKQEYFHSIRELFDRLTPAQQRRVMCLNDFETAYALVKGGEKKKGLKMGLCVLRSPVTTYLAAERCFRKAAQKKIYKQLLKKYSNISA